MAAQTAAILELAQSVAAQAAATEAMVDAMLSEADDQGEDDQPRRYMDGTLVS